MRSALASWVRMLSVCVLAPAIAAPAAAGPSMYVGTHTMTPSPYQAVCVVAARLALQNAGFVLLDAADGPATFGGNVNYTATVVCNAQAGFVVVVVSGRDQDEAMHYANWILDDGWPQ